MSAPSNAQLSAPVGKSDVVTDEHLDSLQELTQLLAAGAPGQLGSVIYHGEGGCWQGLGYCKDGEVAVQTCEAGAGVVLPEHAHYPAREFLIVVRGAIRVDVGGIESVYLRGSCAEFAPGQAHTVTTLEPTRLVAVTVPADPLYPDGIGN